jgi:hypothetical protein
MNVVNEIQRVAWRRATARCQCVGYLVVSDGSVRLAGRERDTNIDAALTIPAPAVAGIRTEAEGDRAEDGRAVVLELRDDVAVLVQPAERGRLAAEKLARSLRYALELDPLAGGSERPTWSA